jgi:hypothetical protein
MDIREGSDNGEPPVALGNETLKSYYRDVVEKLLESVKFRV